MKVLVTGGAGFIGTHTCRALLARGHDVTVLDDLSTGPAGNLAGLPLTLRHGSVTDADDVRAALGGASCVVHLAAVSSVPASFARPADTFRINARGTDVVLREAGGQGAHVIVASSAAVYGDRARPPIAEGVPAQPLSPYAASKYAAELKARAWQSQHGVAALVLRFFNVFGPLQRAGVGQAVVPSFVSAAIAGRPLPVFGDGRQLRDFVPVSTVAGALADAVERRLTHPSPVNLALGTPISLLGLIGELELLLGRRLPREHLPLRSGDIRASYADSTLFRRLFPVAEVPPLGDALRETVSCVAALTNV